MISYLIAFLFRLAGWKIKGNKPVGVPKAIWVVTPHTSNLDFFIGLGTRATLRLDIGFLAKSELFTWYAGWFFRSLGGYPVERKKASNLVDAVAKTFQEHDTIHISIAPEGTRKDVQKLKTGFYYMAQKASVPIILVHFSWKHHLVTISDPIATTNNIKHDMKQIYNFYTDFDGTKKSWLKNYIQTATLPDLH